MTGIHVCLMCGRKLPSAGAKHRCESFRLVTDRICVQLQPPKVIEKIKRVEVKVHDPRQEVHLAVLESLLRQAQAQIESLEMRLRNPAQMLQADPYTLYLQKQLQMTNREIAALEAENKMLRGMINRNEAERKDT